MCRYFVLCLIEITYLSVFSENHNLHKTVEKLESELMELKEKYEGMKISKQEAIRELLHSKDTHNDVVTHIKADLMNESTFQEDIDRCLADVRAQVFSNLKKISVKDVNSRNCVLSLFQKVFVKILKKFFLHALGGTLASRKRLRVG